MERIVGDTRADDEEALVRFALDRIGAAIVEQGLTLDDLIESGRDERASLLSGEQSHA